MNIPIVLGLKSLRVEGTAQESSVKAIDEIIRKTALKKGHEVPGTNRYETVYEYADDRFKMRFRGNSFYENYNYSLEVNEKVWDAIPEDINPFMINEGTIWNHVYMAQESPDRTVVINNLPGYWTDLLAEYA